MEENKPEQIVALYERYIHNQATKEELNSFLSLMEDPANQVLLEQLLGKTWDEIEKNEGFKIPGNSELPDNMSISSSNRFRKYLSVAAMFLLMISAAVYFLSQEKKEDHAPAVKSIAKSKQDIPPGGNKAILTLADGSQIVLNDVQNGNLASQGNAAVVKVSGGQLAYHTDGNTSSKVLYNTVATPLGGQYQLTLSDGTRVWLNASSSIHFPTAFSGNQRQVGITGEVYFEVAKNKDMPFLVKVKDVSITVLGTHFNVMAYEEEKAVSTTLLEGKVNVTNVTGQAVLSPGEQATALDGNSTLKVKKADTDEAVAWMTGFFQFENADVKSIMRQLARWYDIEVVYEPGFVNRRFGGRISRNQQLSEVLHVLELNNIHFKTEGRRVMVLP